MGIVKNWISRTSNDTCNLKEVKSKYTGSADEVSCTSDAFHLAGLTALHSLVAIEAYLAVLYRLED
jgi:hypothetical protein